MSGIGTGPEETGRPAWRSGSGRRLLTAEGTRYARIVGRAIGARRRRMGISQAELASRVTDAGYRTSEAAIHSVENGYTGGQARQRPRDVPVDLLMALARTFNCSPVDLLADPCPTCEGWPPPGFTCNHYETGNKEQR